VRTVNVVERLNEEVKRRTRVARLFPNEASCERLVTAVVADIHEEWAIGKKYLSHESDVA
jgi:transposase-like protein